MNLQSLFKNVSGKWQASRALASQVRHFQNWPEIWSAYRAGETLPQFQLRNGLVLHHTSSDDPIFLFREIFLENCYFSPGFYKPKASDLVLDVGANIGFFALYLQSLAPGIQIHCFEPGEEARSRLAHNIASNRLDSSVSVHPVAIFNAETTLELKDAALSAHRSVFASEYVEASGSTSVQAIPLEKALLLAGSRRVDLLKIDVEGAEIEIVEGASPSCWQNIARVVVEYHDLLRPGCKERVARALAARGYHEMHSFETSPGLGLLQAQRLPSL